MAQNTKSQNKKRTLWTLVLLLAAAAALVAVLLANSLHKPAWQGGFSVHISEVMTSNTSCPNEEGVLCDWVEIQNTSDNDFDLAGYYLTDEPGRGKYPFPAGSIVPARGYLVIWCSPEQESGAYASFAFKAEGGETVALLNKNRVAVDKCETVPCEKNQSLVRQADGSLAPSDSPTPGFSNDEAGAAAWAELLSGRSGGRVLLSEIMSSNTLYAAPDGNYYDWIEVYNPESVPVSLAGYKLTDREGEPRYSFADNQVLNPGEYLVTWCVTAGSGENIAPFALRKAGGESVILLSPSNTECDRVELPALEKNTSYARVGENWIVSEHATPGFSNDEAGYEAYVSSGGYSDCGLVLSEAMPGNKAVLCDSFGNFSDWIELYNSGKDTLSLKGWFLSDAEEALTKWAFPDVSLKAGEYLLVFASGQNKTEGELHSNFALSAGESVFLTAPSGMPFAVLDVSAVEDNHSLALKSDGTYQETAYATPGYSNDSAGYELFCSADKASADVRLNEISADDWIELKNTSKKDVDLSGYFLTDNLNEPQANSLSGVLPAGGLITIDELSFGINSRSDEVYLLDSEENVLDWAYCHDIPAGGSLGRMDKAAGWFFFESATPDAENGIGFRRFSEAPRADVPAGIYEDTASLTVSLSGDGAIYYTTDGSTPTEESERYSAPLTISETTVLRAACIEPGVPTGKDLVLGYYLNEDASLPIVSLVTDSANLFGGQGIYSMHEMAWAQKWEREASLSMYEPEGDSFTIDCGIRIHGRTSRRVSEKRSFTVKFRGKYGGDLDYDVFGDGTVTDFSTLLLRTTVGDNYNTYLRDELFAALAMKYTKTPAQNFRYVSLYLNGEYWGIYAIREHHDEDYFASHYGVDAETVDMQTGEFRYPGAWEDLLTYAETRDLSTADGWNYVQEHLDVNSLLDWLILECYGGDTDVYENVRFYASKDYEDGRYVYGLTDMDLTMQSHESMYVGFDTTSPAGILPVALRSNPAFQQAFLTRLGELLNSGLAAESVNTELDSIASTIESEVDRDLTRWYASRDNYNTQLSRMREFINGRRDEMINAATAFFGLSAEQAAGYFS